MSIGEETMRVLIGNRVWLASNGVNFLDAEDEISSHETQGRTVVLMALDGVFTGWFAVEDTLKDDSAYAIKALQSMGIMVVVLTGDNKQTAAAIIGPLGTCVHFSSPFGFYSCVALFLDGTSVSSAL